MALVNKVFSDIITFTRASTGTFFNSAGVLQSAGNDVPRFDYDPSTLAAQGLLIEDSRTNRFANSSASGSVTLGTGTSIAPDGNLMAKAVCPSGVASFPQIGNGTGNTQSFTLTAGNTIDIALSGYFAAGTAGMVIEPRIIADARTAPAANMTYAELQINTSNWTVRSKSIGVDWSEVQAPSITLFRGNVYRVTWVVRYTQGATIRDASSVYVQLRDIAGSGTFTGDGIGHFQYFGIQGETGSFPTSTILTTTAAATRYEDRALVNTLAPWFNTSTGTIYAEFALTQPASGLNQFLARFSDNSYNNSIADNVTGSGFAQLATASGGVFDGTASTAVAVSANTVTKFAGAYAANDLAACKDGGTVAVDPSATIPSGLTRFDLGSDHAGANRIRSGYLRRITYYPRRLSNVDLQAITA